ncbi:MAG: DUF333 domain-containing protein [Nitrospirae bacterium]|nr:DUF333 domain-containing protein [Nitrospirota bacterium]
MIANPASVNCIKLGGTLEIKDSDKGQYGLCHLPGDFICEEWALFTGKCLLTPATVYSPSDSARVKMSSLCSLKDDDNTLGDTALKDGDTALSNCMAKLMKNDGASKEAILLTGRLNGRGYCTKVKGYGNIAAATYAIPSEKSAQQWVAIIYETHKVLDLFAIDTLKQLGVSPPPGTSVWPDGGLPVHTLLSGGVSRFVCVYLFKKCDTCAVTGKVEAVFEFDKDGRFLRMAALHSHI